MKTLLHILLIAALLFGLSACEGASQFDMTERPDATGEVLRMTDTHYKATERFGDIKKSGVINSRTVEYDRDGHISAETYYDNKGNISGIVVYEYDGKGHLTRFIERKADKDDVIYSVVEKGNTRIITKPNGTTKKKIEGRIVFEFDNETLIQKNTYDERGRILLEEDILDGDTQEYRYDEKGLSFYCIADAKEKWDSDVRLVEFDSHGNWTKAYMYYRGKVVIVRERIFTYWN